ncbi:MAG: TIGR01777 family protein [Candidatus Hydrogenedentota bacterium]|jgi:uncharacterized protein (TIGR01777 family)|uniref:Cell division inhibitor n=1 Tax=Sumerlaea chitinivorans TaxID=2250252 RepID=A0A2Z4Y3B2_SUMC1|nr:Cell division inhibitor [Candidatus Sumerlaea chitinivorans]RMH27184.1 MAG: TIGR01777 family protein [Candidatus Hydrogenedentota bacterium]
MRILVSGASGFIGRPLVETLRKHGHDVIRLVRRPPAHADERYWNPQRGEIQLEEPDAAPLKLDAVVHLAGENITGGRWSPAKKARIRESRVVGTRLLAETLAGMANPPRIFICASAIGIYGDRGEEMLTEDSPPGQNGFLVEVAREWEASANVAQKAGIRVVNLRLGVVLGLGGGALAAMLPPFRWGLGGPLGSGQQFISWIALEDVLACVEFVLAQSALSGPVNCVAPNPVTNREFTRELARILGRPAFFRVPELAIKLLFGEMGRELLLASTRVYPKRLLDAGFHFSLLTLGEALEAILKKDQKSR